MPAAALQTLQDCVEAGAGPVRAAVAAAGLDAHCSRFARPPPSREGEESWFCPDCDLPKADCECMQGCSKCTRLTCRGDCDTRPTRFVKGSAPGAAADAGGGGDADEYLGLEEYCLGTTSASALPRRSTDRRK